MSDLQGRVALVTGGGRDVGAGISRMLAERGASVAVNYHSSKAEAEAVVAEIKQAGGQAKAYQADIADAEIVKKMIADIKGDFGGLDILVNNAGLVYRAEDYIYSSGSNYAGLDQIVEVDCLFYL